MRENNYLLAMAGVVVIIIIKLLIPLLFKRGLCCSLGTYFFGKNLALSYQNNRKNKFSKRMWPYDRKA